MIRYKLLLILIVFSLPLLYGFTPTDILSNQDNNLQQTIQLEKLFRSENTDLIISHIEEHNIINNNYFCFNNNKLCNILEKYKESILLQTYQFIDNNNHICATNILNNAYKYFYTDTLYNNLINLNNHKITTENLIPYTGKIEHLSFQTLMAFPNKALNTNNNLSGTYDEEKLTTNEFKAILFELYKNNYILIDIYDIINKENFNLNTLLLPPNKKPIVLSFDNVTYKSNYQNIGEIDKIIIDRNNNLATYTTKKSIQDRIQYDNEFIVILEKFIQDYPEFSHNNARGIIFLSGENGILGYNTNHKNASHKFEAKRASEVIKKLKSLGWRFGCNNYTYSDENNKSDMDFAKELSLWNKEIRSIVGNTPLYAHPYGIDCENHTKKDLLLADGYRIFFINSNTPLVKQSGNIYTISRKEINGQTLRNNKEDLSHLFDCEKVYDHIDRIVSYYN